MTALGNDIQTPTSVAPGAARRYAPADGMAVRRWQKSQWIYVHPRTGLQSIAQAAAPWDRQMDGQTNGRIALFQNAPYKAGGIITLLAKDVLLASLLYTRSFKSLLLVLGDCCDVLCVSWRRTSVARLSCRSCDVISKMLTHRTRLRCPRCARNNKIPSTRCPSSSTRCRK